MANPTQIYSIVNSLASQATGNTSIAVVDERGLVSLGNTVLSSSSYTDSFLNVLVKRIGKTIIENRAYKNMFADLMVDSLTWGAIVQKLDIEIMEAESDESYGLTDGASVDHYKIKKPTVKQHLFVTDSPYQFKVTIQRKHLQEAFTSAGAMGSFINAIYSKVNDSLEFARENLGRTCLCNLIGERATGTNAANYINLCEVAGKQKGESVTVNDFLYKVGVDSYLISYYLRQAVATIKNVSNKMTSMSKIYNDGSITKFTPKKNQKLYMISDFVTLLNTELKANVFNKEYFELENLKTVPYWQSIEKPFGVHVKLSSNGATKNLPYVVAVLTDEKALGMYNMEEWTATTPFNAAGGYTNTFWHEKQLWFNDLSENAVVFYLADYTHSA